LGLFFIYDKVGHAFQNEKERIWTIFIWYSIRLQVNVVPQCRYTLQYVVSYVKFLEDFAQTKSCSAESCQFSSVYLQTCKYDPAYHTLQKFVFFLSSAEQDLVWAKSSRNFTYETTLFFFRLWDLKIARAWKKQFHISRKYAFL
jgi:hypothetical protein